VLKRELGDWGIKMEWLNYLQSLGILLLILSLLPLVAHLYKKYQIKNTHNSIIKVLEIKPLSYKAQLLLIEIEGKRFLIGLTDKGFSYLGEVKND
jgi:flagellar protein FliO/FliZ